MKDLPRLATSPQFAAVANYLRGERTELRAYELARRIAHVFDQYLVFRPKMVLDWDAGRGEGLAANPLAPIGAGPLRAQHQAALGLQLIDALKRDRAPVPGARLDLRDLDPAPRFTSRSSEKFPRAVRSIFL